MIGNALKSVYKYMGLCIIGTLACTVYIPSAYADICFLPGGDCVKDIDDNHTYTRDEEPDTPSGGNRETCSIAVEPANEICVKCADGNFKNCECAGGFERVAGSGCIATCKGGSSRQADGSCACPYGTTMCDDTCMANTKTGNFVLNPVTCRYDCQTGTERVTGLEGCYDKCDASLGETHNTTNGKCECPSGQEHVAQSGNVCKPLCPANQSRDAQGVCQPGPRCESPEILIDGSCYDCSDYVLKDRYSDSYSDSVSDRYSNYTGNESCRANSSNRNLPSDVRNQAGGSCTKCHNSVNLWKCNVKGIDVRNYADLCYALGYTYNTSNDICSSSFVPTTTQDIKAYNSAVVSVKNSLRAWGLSNANIFTGSTCTECPFNSNFKKCESQCKQFNETHGDAVWMEETGKYTCLECPEQILYEGAGSTMNMYFCHRNDCPDGTVYDANEDECVNQTCGDKGFQILPPIDLCRSGNCGLPSESSIIGSVSDSVSGGKAKCQYSSAVKYTAAQANKLTNAGYACSESAMCPGLYSCEPAKSLASAVTENGGTCTDCGNNPKTYQCKIGGRDIHEPTDLCDYLGFTLSWANYNEHFANDTHVTGCDEMVCGVGRDQYGNIAAGGMYTSRYKCSCANGYTYSNTGCSKNCNPICGYSDSCSAGDHYSDNISGCIPPAPIPEPEDPEQRCYKEGYTLVEGADVFECGYYTPSTCALCPYTNNPKMYKCSSGDKNELCDVGSTCWCCMYPDSQGCEVTPPEPNCDDYSHTSYSDMYSGYLDECGKTNRSRCYTDGYSDVSAEVLATAEGCVACPYPHTGNTLYKGCYVPNSTEICNRKGYTTDAHGWEMPIRNNQAMCDRCPEAPLEWVKNCSFFCADAGYNVKAPTCSSGQTYDTVNIGSQTTCYTDCYTDSHSDTVSEDIPTPPEPDPVIPNSCEIRGFYKASGTELAGMADGSLQCTTCPMDSSYINGCIDLAERCQSAGYTVVDVRGYVSSLEARGYTCTRCPYSSKYAICYEPAPVDPCDAYSTVPCNLTTHQCKDMISGCGCIECSEPDGVKCTKDQQCSQALNAWGRCEGTCNCTGVKCNNGETCKQTNACGNCVAGQCECPDTKCGENQICTGSLNACGNCKASCVDKGCPTGYSPTNPGGCPDTAPSGDGTFTCYGNYKKCACPSGKSETCADNQNATNQEVVGDTTCFTCVNKTCSDYGYQSSSSCGYDYNPKKVTPGGLTCYQCVAKKCGDYPGEQSSSSCSGGYKAETRYHGDLRCYECVPDDSHTDTTSDAISDGISNGNGGGSSSDCPPECWYSEPCGTYGNCTANQNMACEGLRCANHTSSACVTDRYAKCKGCRTMATWEGTAGCKCSCY